MKLEVLKKKYGLSSEAVKFYIKIKKIKKCKCKHGITYRVSKGFDELILEKSTVFKYCVVDSWQEDIREYVDFVKHTGPVKTFNGAEKKRYEQELLAKEKKGLK